ncbi:MAG: hypothetical protein GY871_18515 [Actinomycetales bacterium]|nr:hypothetical protein [Actinomycetales bacterium]
MHSFGPPAAVSSTGNRSNVRTTYHYEQGPQVEAVGAWLDASDAAFTMEAEIECEAGTISFALGRTPEIEVRTSDGETSGHPEASEGGTGYDLQARSIIDAIVRSADDPPVTLSDATRAGIVLEREIESLESSGERMTVTL